MWVSRVQMPLQKHRVVEASQRIEVIVCLEVETVGVVGLGVDDGYLLGVIEWDPNVNGYGIGMRTRSVYLLHQSRDRATNVNKQG